MPNSVINYTANGVPYLDADNYLAIYPAYTAEIAAKLEQVGSPTAAVLELLTQAQAARDAAIEARDAILAAAFTARRSRAVRTDSFAIPDNAVTRIAGYTKQYDTGPGAGGMMAAATGLLTIPEAGGYVVNAGLAFTPAATGRKFAQIERGSGAAGTNTLLIREEVANTPSGNPSCAMSVELEFSAGDVLALCAYQNSGAALNVRGDVWPVYLSARRVW